VALAAALLASLPMPGADAIQARPAGAAVRTPTSAPLAGSDHVVVGVASQYAPGTVQVYEGDTLQLLNVDNVPHNVFSRESKPDGKPLFASALITGPGATAPVVGVDALDAGSYQYFCTVHANMVGTLAVEGGPSPVPSVPSVGPPPAGPPVAVGAGVVASPTSITIFGDSLYATSYAAGNVQRLPLLAGGALGPAATYASGFTNPLGITFAPDGTLFVADSHPSSRPNRTTAGRVQAVPPGGGPPAVVIDELPNGRHNTNGMAVRNGRLFIANGNSTDDGVAGGQPEEPLSGALVSVPLGARGLTPTSPLVRPDGTGMRNVFDVAFRPGTDEAWMPTNGPDALDPFGEDALHVARIQADDVLIRHVPDFGFPGCVYKSSPTGPQVGQNSAVAATKPCSPTHTPPVALFGLHVSANGLAFGPPGGYWDGDLFVAEYGNNPGETMAGHQIVRVPIDEFGRAGTPVQVLPGVSPLDVTFGPEGLYVADFFSGQIMLLRPPPV
jgi:plastocyanin/glucose/arabinose dehydrogenase